jgi:hypothetical protein
LILTFNSEMEGEWEAINKSSSVSKVGNLMDFALSSRANHREFLPLLKKSEAAGKRRQGARKIQESRIQEGGDFPPTLSICMTLLMGEAWFTLYRDGAALSRLPPPPLRLPGANLIPSGFRAYSNRPCSRVGAIVTFYFGW